MGKRIVLFLIALCNWCLVVYPQTSKVIATNYDTFEDRASISSQKIKSTIVRTQSQLEYIIVTSNELKEAFLPLVDWKQKKGVPSAIVTIEEIKKEYNLKDVPLAIKSYLRDKYDKEGLKYVLLGGGIDVIPTRLCYGKVNVDGSFHTNKVIPTDMYYQCFGENLEWNANGNKLYGEPNDGISLKPNIYLSRATCHNIEEVKVFVDKIIEYETSPVINNTFLFAGYSFEKYSKEDIKATKLFNEHIKGKWKGETPKYFFNTKKDFDMPISLDSYNQLLSSGYSFVNVISHGNKESWQFGRDGAYDYNQVSSINNKAHTIIMTEACFTNDFTYYNHIPDLGDGHGSYTQCSLGETFIKSAESGVVAYIGCSVEGLREPEYSKKYGYGASYAYDESIYDKLFNGTGEKNLAKVVAEAKYERAAVSSNNNDANYYNYRWVQFGLNVLGDPEMPIYTTKPNSFDKVTISSTGSTLTVKTNVDDCRICVMSTQDKGKSCYMVAKGNECVFNNVSGDLSIVVTKQNYIPYIKTTYVEPQAKNVYVQNENINGEKSFWGENIYVGTDVTTSKQKGDVRINGGTYIFDAEKYVIKPNVYISRDAKITVNRRM